MLNWLNTFDRERTDSHLDAEIPKIELLLCSSRLDD